MDNYENEYISNLQRINSNLRNQLDYMFKLLKIKIKMEENSSISRLENILNELEILKTSLSFSMQKQANIVSKF